MRKIKNWVTFFVILGLFSSCLKKNAIDNLKPTGNPFDPNSTSANQIITVDSIHKMLSGYPYCIIYLHINYSIMHNYQNNLDVLQLYRDGELAYARKLNGASKIAFYDTYL